MAIDVFVQTCPQRAAALKDTVASLEQSDVGTAYTVVEHPPGITVRQFFVEVMRRMAASACEYVLRLEDDVIVNRHLLHNVMTWPALRSERFGCGWLYVPDGVARHYGHLGARQTRDGDFYRVTPVHGSLGVLLPTASIAGLLPGVQRYFAANLGECGQDVALSTAVCQSGGYIFLHRPPLVEHRAEVPSVLAHPGIRTTGGTFRLDWRREPADHKGAKTR